MGKKKKKQLIFFFIAFSIFYKKVSWNGSLIYVLNENYDGKSISHLSKISIINQTWQKDYKINQIWQKDSNKHEK